MNCGRITYDYFVVFDKMDHEYMRACIITDIDGAAIAFTEHAYIP